MTHLSKRQMIKFIVMGMLVMGVLCIVISLSINSANEKEGESIPLDQLVQQYWTEQSIEEQRIIAVEEQKSELTAQFSEAAPVANVNEAEANEMIAQPPQASSEQQLAQDPSELTTTNKIDINRATVEQLVQLKGIGPSKAQAIVDDREAKGKFKNINDIKRVKGIGEKLFDGIKESIVVSP